MIRRLAHLCFTTNNLEGLIAFYRDQLGLPVKFRFATAENALFGAYIAAGDSSFIEFFDRQLSAKVWGDGSVPAPLTNGNRYGHFCFEVTGLSAFRETLLARGLEVGPIKTGLDGSLQAWLADPDGNRIELMEYTHASAQLAPGNEGRVHAAR